MDAALVAAIAATPAAAATANLYAANLASLPGTPIENLAEAAATLPSYLLAGGGLSADPIALCAAALGACAVWIAYANHLMGSAGARKGEEHGSSRWATKAEMRAFSDAKDHDNNIILTQNCALALVPRRFDQKTDRNKNVMVVGGSGSGKTRYFVKPNLLQMNCSYFVTDPKATLAAELRGALGSAGYRVVEFSTIDMNGSAHYNPIAYVKNEADVLTFVECLIRNTSGDGEHSGDPFWEEAERLLYVALVSYLVFHCPEADRNVPGLLTLLGLAEAREEDEGFKSPLDIVFEELERGARFTQVGARNAFDVESRGFDDAAGAWRWVGVANPVSAEEDFALSNYKAFKTAAGKTLKSIIISCNVRLKPLSVKEVSALLSRGVLVQGSVVPVVEPAGDHVGFRGHGILLCGRRSRTWKVLRGSFSWTSSCSPGSGGRPRLFPSCGGVAAGRKRFRAIARHVAKVPSAVAHRLGRRYSGMRWETYYGIGYLLPKGSKTPPMHPSAFEGRLGSSRCISRRAARAFP